MAAQRLQAVQAAHCLECRGLSLHRRDLRVALGALVTLEPRQRAHGQRRCGRCRVRMIEKSTDGVVVDACSVCDRLFLDPGELERLKELVARRRSLTHPATAAAAAAMAAAMPATPPESSAGNGMALLDGAETAIDIAGVVVDVLALISLGEV